MNSLKIFQKKQRYLNKGNGNYATNTSGHFNAIFIEMLHLISKIVLPKRPGGGDEGC